MLITQAVQFEKMRNGWKCLSVAQGFSFRGVFRSAQNSTDPLFKMHLGMRPFAQFSVPLHSFKFQALLSKL